MPFLTFPPPSGPYSVGQGDVMWEGRGGMRLVIRIFYPARPTEAETCAKAEWLPTSYGANAVTYAESYARFFWKPGVTSAVVGGMGFLPLMKSVTTQTLDGAAVADDLDALHVIVYSHGLGGNRSCYSSVCIDMASHGYVVVCPEHADGSASISILPDKSVVPHRSPNSRQSSVETVLYMVTLYSKYTRALNFEHHVQNNPRHSCRAADARTHQAGFHAHPHPRGAAETPHPIPGAEFEMV